MAAPITRTPTITIADVPPTFPLEGDLWWSTITGQQNLWFDDGNSTQWVVTNWGVDGGPGPEGPPGPPGTSSVFISDVPPDPPTANQLWWSSVLGQLFVWYNDGNTTQWVQVAPSSLSVNTSIERSVATMAALSAVIEPYPKTIESAGRTTPGDGGGGTWTFVSGDQSAVLAQDAARGLYVPPNSDPTGASGVWARVYNGVWRMRWFGCVPDGATDNIAAIDAMLVTHGLIKSTIDGENLTYGTSGQHRMHFPGISLQNMKLINLDHSTVNHAVLQADSLAFTRFDGQIVGNTLSVTSFVIGSALAVGMRITDFSGGRVLPCYIVSGAGLVWTVDGIPQTTTPGDRLEGWSLVDGVTMKNISVDRNNMVMSTSSTNSATINIAGYINVLLEDIEVFGDGCGKGIQVSNSMNIDVLRPYVHDMAWVLPANPGQGGEQISAIFFAVCGTVLLDAHKIEHIEGFVQIGAGPLIPQKGSAYVPVEGPPGTWTITQTYQNTDGADCGGCWDVIFRNGYTIDVGEGVDCSGSRNVNILLLGNSYYDVNGYAEKTSSEQWKFTSIGARSYRAGLQSFVCAGTPMGGYPSDIAWYDAQAYDTGFYGAWFDVPDTGPSGPTAKSWNIAGFGLENDALARIKLSGCKAISTYAKYGAALNDGQSYIISDFDAVGFTVSKYNKTNPGGTITEFNASPTGFKIWGGATVVGRAVASDIHSGGPLSADGPTTLNGETVVVGTTSLKRYALFDFVGTAFDGYIIRNDDGAICSPFTVQNHGIAGIGSGVQQRVTLAKGNVDTGDFASMIETLAIEDWSSTGNKSAQVNVRVVADGASALAGTFDGAGISSTLGIKGLAKTTTSGLGYGAGAGSATVTQPTGKTTSIASNGMCGRLVLASGGGGVNSIPAGGSVAFNFNNSATTTSDYVAVKQADNASSTFGAYAVFCRPTGAGTNQIIVRNLTAGALDEPLAIDFMVFRSSSS